MPWYRTILSISVFCFCSSICLAQLIADQINKAYTLFETENYPDALKMAVDFPDSIMLADKTVKLKLAILKYYDYRAKNKGKRARSLLPQSSDPWKEAFHDKLQSIYSFTYLNAYISLRYEELLTHYAIKENPSVYEQFIVLKAKAVKAKVNNDIAAEKKYREAAINIMLQSGLENHPEVTLELRTLGNLARVYSDFEQAINYFTQEKQNYLSYYDSTHLGVGVCEYNIASIHYSQLNYQKSADHFLRALPIFKKYDLSATHMRHLYEGLGDMHFELNNHDKAAFYWGEANALTTAKSTDLFDITKYISDSLVNQNNIAAALHIFDDALNFRKKQYGHTHPLTAECEAYIARAHDKSNNYFLAAKAYHRALQIYFPALKDTAIISVPSEVYENMTDAFLFESLVGKARNLFSIYRLNDNIKYLKSAKLHCDLALDLLSFARVSKRSDGSQLFWSQIAHPLFETRLAICEKQLSVDSIAAVERAFNLMESSKGFLLRSALLGAKAFEILDIPAQLIEQEANLRSDIITYSAKIDNEEKRCEAANQQYINAWKQEALRLRSRHGELVQQIRDEYPKYYDLKFASEVKNITDVRQKLIGNHDLFISTFIGTESIYAVTISKEKFDFHKIKIDQDLIKALDSFPKIIKDVNSLLHYPAVSKKHYCRLAHYLYKKIFDRLLVGHVHAKSLLISPDGILNLIPFEALLLSLEGIESYNTMDFLVNTYDISYAPSATVLLQGMTTDQPKSKYKYLGMAPSYGGLSEVTQRNTVGQLHLNDIEVKRVAKKFNNAQALFGPRANKRNFQKLAPNASIVHLAAHASVDDERPLLSHILFNSDEDTSSRLSVYEIYNMPLTAELAVLSACNSGSGTLRAGEGVMSLARAFQYSGCPSTLFTLWSVDDQSSAELVEGFFANIKLKLTKNSALSEAKRQYIANADPASAHPYFWAGYILMGDARVVQLSAQSNNTVLFSGIVIALLFIFHRIFRTKSKL